MITTLKELRTYIKADRERYGYTLRKYIIGKLFLWNIVARFIYFIIFVYVNMQRTVAGKVLYIHSFI